MYTWTIISAIAASIAAAIGIWQLWVRRWSSEPEGTTFIPKTLELKDGRTYRVVEFRPMGATVMLQWAVTATGATIIDTSDSPPRLDSSSQPIQVALSDPLPGSTSTKVEIRWVASTRRKPLVHGRRYTLEQNTIEVLRRSKLLPWRFHWVTPKPKQGTSGLPRVRGIDN